MCTVLQRYVSTHMSHLQARTILVYKVTALILGSQTLKKHVSVWDPRMSTVTL